MAANGYVELAKGAAQRTFIPGSDSTAGGQDDVATPAFLAWSKEARAGRCLDASLAMLAVVASQALFVTEREAPRALREFVELVRTYVAPVVEDRILGPELEPAHRGHHRQHLRARREHRLEERVSRFDTIRRRAAAVENAVIDEYLAGRIGRREFLRYAAVLGFSAPLAARASRLARAAARAAAPAAPDVTLTVGMTVPAGLIDPLTVGDTGGICLLSQCGEYLAVSDPDLHLKPALAESWQPNADGSVWTFKIRRDVRFHDGRTLSAHDVAATIDRLADPANGSIALSAFAGTLSKGGTRALDDATPSSFGSTRRTAAFPTSSPPTTTTPSSCRATTPAVSSAASTAPARSGSSDTPPRRAPRSCATRITGERSRCPSRVLFDFYDNVQAQVLAMQGGQLDVLLHVPVQGSQALLDDPRLSIVALKSSAHEQLHMRTDRGPFADKRVRRAVALSLNRQNLVRGMFRGRASLGNDSPFAPIFAATDPTVPQRDEDLARARALLAEAGVPNGFRAGSPPSVFRSCRTTRS